MSEKLTIRKPDVWLSDAYCIYHQNLIIFKGRGKRPCLRNVNIYVLRKCVGFFFSNHCSHITYRAYQSLNPGNNLSCFPLQHLLELAPNTSMHSMYGATTSRLPCCQSQLTHVTKTFHSRMCLSFSRKPPAKSWWKQFKFNTYWRADTLAGGKNMSSVRIRYFS